MNREVIKHYDWLNDENNDPVYDTDELKVYMDKWDGEEFIKRITISPDNSVLEIGVGTGRLAVRVAPLAGKFTGVDLSPKTINRAKENLFNYSNITLICDDFLLYNFSEKFDVIYSSLTFMHIKDKKSAFEKIYMLLNENGRFFLSVDKSQENYIDMGTRKLKIYPDTTEKIMEISEKTGFFIEEQYETEFAHIFVFKKG